MKYGNSKPERAFTYFILKTQQQQQQPNNNTVIDTRLYLFISIFQKNILLTDLAFLSVTHLQENSSQISYMYIDYNDSLVTQLHDVLAKRPLLVGKC